MNKFKHISLEFLVVIIFIISSISFLTAADEPAIQDIKANFLKPPMDCRPHTYWWWPGNAVTEEEITWQLEQMQTHGMGGVLITSAAPEVYEKGNIPFLSDEHIKMLDHAVREAKRLKMEVNLNFAPGWVFGGYWVAPGERAQSLVPVHLDLHGPTKFNSELPKFTKATDRRFELSIDNIPEDAKLVAVVAGKVKDNTIESSSLIELTSGVRDNILTWEVPEGTWRLMVFWLKHTGQMGMYVKDTSIRHWCVDHFSKSAMRNYCNFLGNKYYSAFGDEFGKTVEAVHCDSWELANLPNGIYWSDSLMIKFRQNKGYDLTKYLPAIWWKVGEISPRIRYDVNEFIHETGLETHFRTFLDWCESHDVKGSMEAIGFPMDILKGSGMAHLPVNEVTPGEKDGVPWFDTRIGVKKYVTSGAHIYNRNIVGVEAYTFIHWELYRATLEELKIASDGFLRSGANKFYNHGYSYSAERNPTPSRSIPFAARISPVNIWWKYYPLLADYIGRCSYLLRQGEFAPDIAVYSPLANQWTLNVLNARKWTREFYWGDLGKLLVANGYDFDLLNDEALQTMACIEDGNIKIGNLEYKILILPNIKSLPLETLLFIQNYVKKGGTVIALENIPGRSVGFENYINKDDKVKSVIDEMFSKSSSTKAKIFGEGRTFFMKWVINRQDVLDWQSSALDPFVNALRAHCPPDFGIDFMHEGLRENNGLSFLHRKSKQMDIYFVSNIQDKRSAIPVTFRVKDKSPWAWNPYNGEILPIHYYTEKKEGIEIPLNLKPYESVFIVFQDNVENRHVEYSNFYKITDVTRNKVKALASENGTYFVTSRGNNAKITKSSVVKDIPAPFVINGKWRLKLKGLDFNDFDTSDFRLMSWTQKKPMQYYSGTGRYDINFNLPIDYISDDLELHLDLGKVGNIAEVELNGTPVGTIWMRGQNLDITKTTKVGENQLTVFVTNTLINRVSGMQKAPPVPRNLVSQFGTGMTDYSRGRQKTVEMGFQPLPPSGLMGPVIIKVLKKVSIDIK